jgi:hypothetical protein
MAYIVFLILMVLVAVNFLIWRLGIVPFVKHYTGGKSHCWVWRTACLNDYLLTREIIKKEMIKKPRPVMLWEIVSILQIVCLITFFLIIRKQP